MTEGLPLQSMVELTHHRWNVPVLNALFHAGGGARAIALINKLGVSRNSLRATLASLERLDLATPNPGYGHPLRPEFVLTTKGRRVAPHSVRYADTVGYVDLLALKWTAPTLLALAEHKHFNGLEAALGVGPRPLTQTLKSLVAAGLLRRSVDDGHPPRSWYELVGDGPAASAAARALAEQLAKPQLSPTRRRPGRETPSSD